MMAMHSSAQTPSASGIEGTISLGPTHGGPIRPNVPSSRPFAHVEFVVQQGEQTVASFKTDEQGRFKVSVSPGRYTISMKEKKSGKMGRYGPFEAEVSAGQMARVDWHCDTGMR